MKVIYNITSFLFFILVVSIITHLTGFNPVAVAVIFGGLSLLASKYKVVGAALFTLVDLKWSQGKQNMGGLVGDIFYCPVEDIQEWPELSAAGKLDTADASNFLCKTGKKFISIYHTSDTGKLDDTTVGERDGRSKENLLEFFFPGDDQEVAEFERFALNTPCVVICKDTRGRFRLLGGVNMDETSTEITGDIPAYLEASNGVSGAGRPERKGKTFQFKHSSPHAPIFYKGTIPLTVAA